MDFDRATHFVDGANFEMIIRRQKRSRPGTETQQCVRISVSGLASFLLFAKVS